MTKSMLPGLCKGMCYIIVEYIKKKDRTKVCIHIYLYL